MYLLLQSKLKKKHGSIVDNSNIVNETKSIQEESNALHLIGPKGAVYKLVKR